MSRLRPGWKNLYVIHLRRAAWRNEPRLRKANPHGHWWSPCVYVGWTSLTPEEVVQKASRGHKKVSKYLRQYGSTDIMWDLFEDRNPVPEETADDEKVALAEELRQEGYVVWCRPRKRPTSRWWLLEWLGI